MHPLVSIIIPVYNTADYLRSCIESASKQTLSSIEIICINDGSTDNSLDILESYEKADSRIRVISTKNQGLGAARNIGLKYAKGTWITGLDSDDYLELDACSYVMSHASDDVDVIQYGFRIKHDAYKESLSACLSNGKYKVTPQILISHSCEFCGKFWRKSFIDKHACKFPEGVWYEDWFFYWAYLPFVNKVLYLPECKYVIIMRPSSIMGLTRNKSERVLDHVKVLGKLLNFRVQYPISESFQGLNLINFVQCIKFIENQLPENLRARADEMFREYSQHPLMQSFRIWFKPYDAPLTKIKWFLKFYVAELYIGIFAWFPLRIAVEGGYVVFRLFGRRFFRYAL